MYTHSTWNSEDTIGVKISHNHVHLKIIILQLNLFYVCFLAGLCLMCNFWYNYDASTPCSEWKQSYRLYWVTSVLQSIQSSNLWTYTSTETEQSPNKPVLPQLWNHQEFTGKLPSRHYHYRSAVTCIWNMHWCWVNLLL